MYIPQRSLTIVGPKPAPVEERPRCLHCGKTLSPQFRPIEERVEYEKGMFYQNVAKYFTGRYGYFNAFCGINHAADYAMDQPGPAASME